jgi:CheY-like chemotaxis protein
LLPAIVCDDDAIARGVIANLARGAGFEIIAETDSAGEAIMLVERFGVREVVLDLSLAVGRGEDVIDAVRQAGIGCKLIAFSAYISNPESLLSRGASAVIEKPDFDKLAATLSEHYLELSQQPAPSDQIDRRRPDPARERNLAPRFRSPSGFAPPTEIDAMIDALADGDVLMVFDVGGIDSIERTWGSLVAADHRIELVRSIQYATRTDDEIAVTDDGEVVALLLHPTPETPAAVYRRVTERWRRSDAPGEVRAASATCRSDEPRRGTLGRALGGVRTQAQQGGVTFT